MLARRARIRLLRIAIALSSALTAACSASGSLATLPDSPARLILGEWELLGGCGGIAGRCLDSTALMEPSRYVFARDGFVTAFRGSTEVFRATYTITPGSKEGGGDERPLLTIGGGPTVDPRPLRLRFATPDTAYLDEGCCDRYTFQYHRRR